MALSNWQIFGGQQKWVTSMPSQHMRWSVPSLISQLSDLERMKSSRWWSFSLAGSVLYL